MRVRGGCDLSQRLGGLGLRSHQTGPRAADPVGMDTTTRTSTLTLADLLRLIGVADDDTPPEFWD